MSIFKKTSMDRQLPEIFPYLSVYFLLPLMDVCVSLTPKQFSENVVFAVPRGQSYQKSVHK